MTIDKAIALVKIERECVIRADVCDRKCEKCDLLQDSAELIDMYEHLAEWLEELKKRRSEDYGYMADIHQSIGYRKALDDFVETLVSAFDETNIKEYGFYPENLVRQVAKQLKEGNK